MSDIPLLSVVVPVFNGEYYIEKTYNNILQQNYSNLEIIFVDNNSEDLTSETVEKLIESDQRVRLFFESKKGAGAARNTGIKSARGEFICFLDCDDDLVPDKFLKQIDLLQTFKDANFIIGDTLKMYADSTHNYVIKQSLPEGCLIEGRKVAFQWMANFGQLPHHCSGLYKTDFVRKIEGYGEALLSGEDAFFLVKAAMHGAFVYQSEVYYEYMRHPDSTVSVLNQKMNPSYRYLEQYLTYYADYLFGIDLKSTEDNDVNKVFLFALMNWEQSQKTFESGENDVLNEFLTGFNQFGFLNNSKWKLAFKLRFLGKKILNRLF
ncbi:glycosyltransferase family 2 protein [Carboxylicivirga linearis]|uniref:Glycosyltransferase family 2 protein n=1 Tax=Carboxylicivirga linearis TaxID=1628157 RepID=A0ABS5JX86_9BACT|nr:glycosyltransferase family 2 protein [Carboxylicivirga linearis]MBS2099076.1 glycosyltransferase family 2 protein [Carboxylicivirga linearis]